MKSEETIGKDVDNDVDNSSESTASKKTKKKSPWKPGKYPFTVFNKETKTLFVRKTITINKKVIDPKTGAEKIIKQRQYWRRCEENTKAAAEEALEALENEISLLKSGRVKPLKNFDEIAQKFEEIELTEANFEGGKKISGKIQLDSPKRHLKLFIAYFGNQDINTITFGQIQEFKKERLNTPVKYKFKKGHPRSIRSVNYELTVLRQVFNFAFRNRWLIRSPFLDGKNLIDSSQENRRYKTWSKKEEKAALDLCIGQMLHMKAVIICICDGGFRKGELLSALWSDVDFKNEVITAKSYKGKTLIERPIYMTARMKEALLEWRKLQKKVKKIDDKNLVIGYKDIKHAWENIRDKINRKDLTIHDLRHVFATRHSNNKTPIRDISLLLGHSKIETTIRYINPTEERLRAATANLEDFED